MRFAVVLLWITSALFIVFGLGFVIAPAELADLMTGASPTTSSGLIDMRATYGGFAVGLGIFVAVAARRPETLRLGLLASLLVTASLGIARLIGIIADGSPNAFMFVNLGLELGSIAPYTFALRRLGSANR